MAVTFTRDCLSQKGAAARCQTKWQSSSDGEVFQDQIKNYPPLARVDTRKAYSKGNPMSKETRKPVNTKRRDKEGLQSCPGSALMACRSTDLNPEIDLIIVDKAEVLLQI